MDCFTPCDISAIPPADVDVDGVAVNLFKDTPIPVPAEEKLQCFLRIRPPDREEEWMRHFIINGSTLLSKPPGQSKAFKNLKGSSGLRQFNFNHIFDETVGQENFYKRCALPMTVRVLKGESSLLFAYGTTNSGKSFTMRGDNWNPGVIPRSLSTLFSCLEGRIDSIPVYRSSRFEDAELVIGHEAQDEIQIRNFISKEAVRGKNQSMVSFASISMSADTTQCILEESHLTLPSHSKTRFSVWVSFVEFYKESIKDLLAVDTGTNPPQLMLVPDANNNYFVRGLRRVSVSSKEEAFHCLLYGWENLHRAATNLNKDSSRSHCVFTISLVGYDCESSQPGRLRQVSNLSFCDLAGSERGDRTKNTGDRLKEAAKINNSLSVLARCVAALRSNQSKKQQQVVPFRESTLTKYFQSYFNGTGMASMIININPSAEYYDETLHTLQFSQDASEITVSNEETKRRLKASFNRLTQQWMQSSQRWSTLARKPVGSDEFTLPATEEEDEEAGDMTNFSEEALNALEESIMETNDPEVMNELISQIDELHERLKAAELNKFEMECNIRKEVSKEVQDLCTRLNKENEEQRTRRLEAERAFDQKIFDLKKKHREENRENLSKIKTLEDKVKELESLLEHQQQRGHQDDQQEILPENQRQEEDDPNDCLLQEKVNFAVNEIKVGLQEEIDRLKTSLGEKTKENDKLHIDLESLNSKMKALVSERDTLLVKQQEQANEVNQMQIQLQSLRSSSKITSGERDQLKQKVTSLMSLSEQTALSEELLVKQLQETRDQRKKLDEDIEEVRKQLKETQTEYEEQINRLNTQLMAEKNRSQSLSRELELTKQEKKQLEEKLSQEITKWSTQVLQKNQELKSKETEHQEEIQQLLSEIESLKQQVSSSESTMKEMQLTINDLKHQKERLLETETPDTLDKSVNTNSQLTDYKTDSSCSKESAIDSDSPLFPFTPVSQPANGFLPPSIPDDRVLPTPVTLPESDNNSSNSTVSSNVSKEVSVKSTSLITNGSLDNTEILLETIRLRGQRSRQQQNQQSSKQNTVLPPDQEESCSVKTTASSSSSSSRATGGKRAASSSLRRVSCEDFPAEIRVTTKRKATEPTTTTVTSDAYLGALKKSQSQVSKAKKPKSTSLRKTNTSRKKRQILEESTEIQEEEEDDEDELTKMTQQGVSSDSESDVEYLPKTGKKGKQQKKKREIPVTAQKKQFPMDSKCLVNSISPIRQEEEEGLRDVRSAVKLRPRSKLVHKDIAGRRLDFK